MVIIYLEVGRQSGDDPLRTFRCVHVEAELM